jgi:hypothetical protein
MNLGSIIYGIAITILKTGILLQWARLFVPHPDRNALWWTCHILIMINILFYTICTFVEIFACTPRQKIWTPKLPGKCLDIGAVNIASSVVNFVSDVIIFLLPQKVIWDLHGVTFRKKLGIAALFAVGILYASHNDPISYPFTD